MSKVELLEGRDYKYKETADTEQTTKLQCAKGCERELMRSQESIQDI